MKPKSSRGLRGSNRTKKELTEAEMTKYISSQDDLDWSTDENGVPAKPNPQTVSARNSIVQPLVQIYLEDGKEDADDTISAMSHDTCWQDDSQAVVELVLPNVLFCDNRDDSEKRDHESWNILFPSYIEECRENSRDDGEAVASTAMSDRDEVEQRLDAITEEDVGLKKSNVDDDDGSVSSGGWEDAVTETESESDMENPAQAIQALESLAQEDAGGQTMEREEMELSPLKDHLPSEASRDKEEGEISPVQDFHPSETSKDREECEISPLQDHHPCETPKDAEEDIEVEFQEPRLPPPTLMLPSLQPPLPPQVEHQSSSEFQPPPSVLLPAGKVDRTSSSPTASQKNYLPSLMKKSSTAPSSPKRRFLKRTDKEKTPVEDPTSPKSSHLLFRTRPKTLESKNVFVVNETLEPTTCDVKEIDVLSDSSHSSNLTNPSMFSSATWSPPPSPPKNCFRAQRRGSVTKFSLDYPYSASVALAGIGPESKNKADGDSLGSNISNAGTLSGNSPTEDKKTEATVHHGIFGGLFRRVLEFPSMLLRRKENAPVEDKSPKNSDVANDGDNVAASWASVSLRSLGGFSGYEDCEDGGTKWWELGSSLLIDKVPCTVPNSTIQGNNSIDESNNDTLTCDSETTVFEDANEENEYPEQSVPPPKDENSKEEKKTPEHSEEATTTHKCQHADDPWSAAKRGDVNALQKWTSDDNHDWSQKDEFGNTALFYACHSGASINISIVKEILDQWPVDQIPPDVLDRCKLNAINSSVVNMLKHPAEAEKIVFAVLSDAERCRDEPILKDDDESLHLSKWLLYDVEEGDEEEEEEGDY
jgi:hypothetical protein